MKNEFIESPNDFKWQQQLRFYLEDEIVCRQINSKIIYGYEYLGIPSKLAITPLTDRCWMTITSALHIKLGCSPAGPAGTGKTESVKDLAKNLGKFCIVYNCSEQVTVNMMHQQFMGSIYTGAWLCLDEFNRIDIEVLSVIAQQVMSMKNALSADPKKFFFGGSLVEPSNFIAMGVFTTMNPGYAGRTELPDNLKVLFRPVSMMVPDYALIAQIMLFSEGFLGADYLSIKMTKLYKLASEQLSQQNHYDFGMRAVKAILTMAGKLKREFPDEEEDLLIIRAMCDVNIPKFLTNDITLFNAIVQDLFPGKKLKKEEDKEFSKGILDIIEKMHLTDIPNFIAKCNEVHDIINIRFGSMLVGPPMSGKTSAFKVITDCYDHLNDKLGDKSKWRHVEKLVMNPKSISMAELYGETNA